MKLVVTGGGSGGHITPILAVVSEVKKLLPDSEVIFIGQRGDKLADVPAADPNITKVYSVRAGKFRRYGNAGWKQVFDVKEQAKNIRDAFRTVAGILGSIRILRKERPNIVFTRGGFVSVPVGLAAAFLKIPYITHDSDSTPSLANRIIARWATIHAVALPEEDYPYPREKTVMVGVPISSNYQPVTPALQEHFKADIGLGAYAPVILVTGGGNGALELNAAVLESSLALLEQYPQLAIVHITGRDYERSVMEAYTATLRPDDMKRVLVKGFVTDLYRYSAAADVIIARAGATNIAEFAVQARTCLLIPPPQLAWAVKNAQELAKYNAVKVLPEAEARNEHVLARTLNDLLDHPEKRAELAANLAKMARPDAAERLANLIIEKAKK